MEEIHTTCIQVPKSFITTSCIIETWSTRTRTEAPNPLEQVPFLISPRAAGPRSQSTRRNAFQMKNSPRGVNWTKRNARLNYRLPTGESKKIHNQTTISNCEACLVIIPTTNWHKSLETGEKANSRRDKDRRYKWLL